MPTENQMRAIREERIDRIHWKAIVVALVAVPPLLIAYYLMLFAEDTEMNFRIASVCFVMTGLTIIASLLYDWRARLMNSRKNIDRFEEQLRYMKMRGRISDL